LKPFHAYDDGNLCWDAAIEVESAALAVHSHIHRENSSSPLFIQDGDKILRDNFHKRMKESLSELNFGFVPRKIIDVGCSTGLSTIKLHQSFPNAEVIGMDLSPHMLSGNQS